MKHLKSAAHFEGEGLGRIFLDPSRSRRTGWLTITGSKKFAEGQGWQELFYQTQEEEKSQTCYRHPALIATAIGEHPAVAFGAARLALGGSGILVSA